MCDWCLGEVGWIGGELLFLEVSGNITVDILIAIIVAVLTVLIPLVAFVYNRKRKLNKYYVITCKRSSSLKPVEVLGIRGKSEKGFNKYYYRRGVDRTIGGRIEKGENVLVIGDPLAGKSRAV